MSDTPEWDEWMLEQGAASPSGPSPDRMPVHDNGMDQADDLDEALATARQQGREEAVREIRAKVLALHPVTPAELFGILDAIAEGTAPDWKEAAVRGYRQGWADAIAGDGGGPTMTERDFVAEATTPEEYREGAASPSGPSPECDHPLNRRSWRTGAEHPHCGKCGATLPSGPSPAAGLPTRTFADAIRAGWHSPDMCSPAAGLDPDLAEQAFKNLGLWGDYPEWTKTRREYAEKFASEYDRLSRSGGEARPDWAITDPVEREKAWRERADR